MKRFDMCDISHIHSNATSLITSAVNFLRSAARKTWKLKQTNVSSLVNAGIFPFNITNSRVLLAKLIVAHVVKTFFTFYGTWRFITVFTKAGHCTLFWARSIRSTPSHSTLLDKQYRLLKLVRRFVICCSCHLQGECLWDCKGPLIKMWKLRGRWHGFSYPSTDVHFEDDKCIVCRTAGPCSKYTGL
jgi:hypothetical protein